MLPRLAAVSLILPVFLVFGQQSREGLHAQEVAPQADSIRESDLRADLFFLAGDAMRGRLVGTPENRLAAEWIKARFERLGLKPAGPGGSFYQPFNLMTATLAGENRLEVAEPMAPTLRLRSGQDFYPLRFSASGEARGAVVFAGFDITSAERSHDDLDATAIGGKIVLVLDHEPSENDPDSPFDGLIRSEATNQLNKTLFAQDRGALGILFVRDVHNHPEPANFEAAARDYWPAEIPRIDRFTLATRMDQVRIPAAQISPALAGRLVGSAGKTLDELATASEIRGGVTPVPLPGPEVSVTTSVDRHVLPDRNVVAVVEGADPQLKDEWVIVCAHYDHNGADGDQVFNGADDDGSGTVGLLEIAEAYALAARAGQSPRRTVLLAAWNSEERGLLGAWAYTERPLWPLDQTVAVLNMDMIGRNEEVPVGGGRRFRGLEIQTGASNDNAVNILGTTWSASMKAAVATANEGIFLDLKQSYDNKASNLMRRSDQWPFLQHGVPALFFDTGLHPDYHTIYDVPERINYPKMTKVVRLVYQMSWDLAQQDGRPTVSNPY